MKQINRRHNIDNVDFLAVFLKILKQKRPQLVEQVRPHKVLQLEAGGIQPLVAQACHGSADRGWRYSTSCSTGLSWFFHSLKLYIKIFQYVNHGTE